MVRRQQAADRAIRPKMRSPGSRSHQRESQRLFWVEIRKGLIPGAAASVVGVSQRWRSGGSITLGVCLLSI